MSLPKKLANFNLNETNVTGTIIQEKLPKLLKYKLYSKPFCDLTKFKVKTQVKKTETDESGTKCNCCNVM